MNTPTYDENAQSLKNLHQSLTSRYPWIFLLRVYKIFQFYLLRGSIDFRLFLRCISRFISIIVFFRCSLSVHLDGPCLTIRSSSSNFWEINFVVSDVFSAINSIFHLQKCSTQSVTLFTFFEADNLAMGHQAVTINKSMVTRPPSVGEDFDEIV